MVPLLLERVRLLLETDEEEASSKSSTDTTAAAAAAAVTDVVEAGMLVLGAGAGTWKF